MKTAFIAAFVFLLGGCPFLPPSPYQHVGYGVYPSSFISLPVGESMEDMEEPKMPGAYDILGVSSELNGETLSATLYLRELPEEMQWGPDLGHMQDFTTQWIVMVETEGDSSTPFKWHDYILKASYYDAKAPRANSRKFLPGHPWVNTVMRECAPDISSRTGEEYNSCTLVAEKVDLDFSYEQNSLTLSATIPGINESSTIAFWTWGMVEEQDYVPHFE